MPRGAPGRSWGTGVSPLTSHAGGSTCTPEGTKTCSSQWVALKVRVSAQVPSRIREEQSAASHCVWFPPSLQRPNAASCTHSSSRAALLVADPCGPRGAVGAAQLSHCILFSPAELPVIPQDGCCWGSGCLPAASLHSQVRTADCSGPHRVTNLLWLRDPALVTAAFGLEELAGHCSNVVKY